MACDWMDDVPNFFLVGCLIGMITGGSLFYFMAKSTAKRHYIRKCECCGELEPKKETKYICPECRKKVGGVEVETE